MRTKRISGMAAAVLLLLVEGCVYTPMTARSRLNVEGEVVVSSTTTTEKIGDYSVTKTVVTKSSAAGDLELKKAELEGRTRVGVAQASGGWWDWFWTPTYYGGPGYYIGGGYVTLSSPPRRHHGGGSGRGWFAPYNHPSPPPPRHDGGGRVTPYRQP